MQRYIHPPGLKRFEKAVVTTAIAWSLHLSTALPKTPLERNEPKGAPTELVQKESPAKMLRNHRIGAPIRLNAVEVKPKADNAPIAKGSHNPINIRTSTAGLYAGLLSDTQPSTVLSTNPAFALTSILRSSLAFFQSPCFTANPTTIEFPNTIIGQNSVVNETLSNGCGVTVGTITGSVTGSSAYTIAKVPSSILSGGTGSFKATFKPPTASMVPYDGSIVISSNQSQSPTIALIGLGVNAHTVDLSWEGGCTGELAGYAILRMNGSVFAGAQGTPVIITPSELSAASTTWIDTSAAAGQTYTYYAICYTTSGSTSPYSNPAVAAVGMP